MYKKKTWAAKAPVIKKTFTPPSNPTEEQRDIIKSVGDKNITHCDAGPGSGKSTMLRWIANVIPTNLDACALAFSSDIGIALQEYTPPHVVVGTCHALSRKGIVAETGKQPFLSKWKGSKIFDTLFPNLDPSSTPSKERAKAYQFKRDFLKLVDYCKMTMSDDPCMVINKYGIDIEFGPDIPDMLERQIKASLADLRTIDFVDMLYSTVALGLPIKKYDVVLLDERQDLNPLMMAFLGMLMKPSTILASSGDRRQSIYGFTGADIRASEKIEEGFPGVSLPLLTSFRCAKSIIAYAREVYPEVHAYEGNPDGEVSEGEMDSSPGNMVISRKNSTLIGPAFALALTGVPVYIKGQSIGDELSDEIESCEFDDKESIVREVTEKNNEKIAKLSKRKNSANLILVANEKTKCVEAVMQTCRNKSEAISRIKSMFTDKGDKDSVVFSSIHRSKGLEADSVTILDHRNIRMITSISTTEEEIQEANLDYVARTRAKRRLILA